MQLTEGNNSNAIEYVVSVKLPSYKILRLKTKSFFGIITIKKQDTSVVRVGYCSPCLFSSFLLGVKLFYYNKIKKRKKEERFTRP